MKSKRIAMVDEIKRALEIAENVPFRYMIQHLGSRAARSTTSESWKRLSLRSKS